LGFGEREREREGVGGLCAKIVPERDQVLIIAEYCLKRCDGASYKLCFLISNIFKFFYLFILLRNKCNNFKALQTCSYQTVKHLFSS
jgi:hypothetical protein